MHNSTQNKSYLKNRFNALDIIRYRNHMDLTVEVFKTPLEKYRDFVDTLEISSQGLFELLKLNFSRRWKI
jgi:hypothetical protein